MEHRPINLSQKLALFCDQWSPKVIAEMNEIQFKLAKLEGEFEWHRHAGTDEAFLVLDGELTLEFRDGRVKLAPGELYVVKKGVEHLPRADSLCHVLVIEPRGVINTGEEVTERTAESDVWI